MRFLLTESNFSLGYELTPCDRRAARQYEKETGNESVLFQSDWDFPSLASSLGWRMRLGRGDRCSHSGTDGTVRCPDCGATATQFIDAAREWLDGQCHRAFNDPNNTLAMYFGW